MPRAEDVEILQPNDTVQVALAPGQPVSWANTEEWAVLEAAIRRDKDALIRAGAPGKIAVISSGLYGTVAGSASMNRWAANGR